MRKSIAIDLDDVLANTIDRWVEVINLCENEDVKVSDIKTWDIHEYFKCGRKVYDYLTYDLFRNLEVKEYSQKIMKELCMRYDVYIVTSATASPQIPMAKVEWIIEHFPFIRKDRIVTCGDKSIIGTDFMIDDAVHNLKGFKGKGFLFNAVHNQDENEFPRINSWLHVKSMFLDSEVQ